MKDDITQPPAEGVYVYGLYLEGAGWDRRGCKLIESKPKVLFEMMPVVRMYAVNNGEISIHWLEGGRKQIESLFYYLCWPQKMDGCNIKSEDAEVQLISSM